MPFYAGIAIGIFDMQSALEKFLKRKISVFWARVKNNDRGVLLGAVLSLIPVFPACTIGVGISMFNLILIYKGKLAKDYLNLIFTCIAFGVIFTLLWMNFLSDIVGFASVVISYILDVFFSVFEVFDGSNRDKFDLKA